MRIFTAVTPITSMLPPELGLLLAPARASEPSAPDEHVGHSEGVLLDECGRVVAFIIRLSPRLVAHRPRTLVSAAAVTVGRSGVLHLSWTEDQLRAQPRLDNNLQPHNRVDGGLPVESQWMSARPNVVPPSDAVNTKEAAKEGLEGGAIGAAIGAAAGMIIGGPIAAASLAVFFAAGGGLAGLLSGASQETAVEAGELKFDNIPPDTDPAGIAQIRLLEERLRDPDILNSGKVALNRFIPMTSTVTKDPPSQPTAAMR